MNEIFFLVEESQEGGYIARSLGESIVTQYDTVEKLYEEIRDAVKCHYDEGTEPKNIRLHFVHEEILQL